MSHAAYQKIVRHLNEVQKGGGEVVAIYGEHSHLYIHGPVSAVKLFIGFLWN
jgi:hypothetical protein